jgi:hypothetical protein
MNPPTVSVQENVNSDPKSKRITRLQGPWLVLFRLAWAVLSIIALFLFIISLPVFFAS